VLEICQHGSLSDVIRGGIIARNSEIIQRNPLGLTITDKMFLALGCARGLHALHSFDKTLVHRDIKSSNFLVDAQLNAKICDLELGGSSASSIDAIKDGMLCTWQAPEVRLGI
jgi:serine/threonine protein kinase